MIYVFVPYYNEDTPEFKKSLESQTVQYRLIKRDRKRDKIYWTKAVRDFQREIQRFCGIKDTDVICIMNNDIEFPDYFFSELAKLTEYDIYYMEGISINWCAKKFKIVPNIYGDSFTGHCFAMTFGDFKRFRFSRLLPHALADIDYGIRVMERQTSIFNHYHVIHKDHDYEDCSIWSPRSYKNPIFWTIFLLKHPNRHTFINILKSWYEIFRPVRKS